MNPSLKRSGVATLLASALVAVLGSTAAPSQSDGPTEQPITDRFEIEQLAAQAYVWGLAPQFVYRFQKFHTLVTAPLNELGGRGVAAAWNNNATNAGNASVLYLNAMLDLSGEDDRGGTRELVLTVPPSSTHYYVVNLLDAFINTVGSIGTRTTPSSAEQTYLIAGPTSAYAGMQTVEINGFTYRVVPYDTNLGWILIRIRADTLVPSNDPASAATIEVNVVERFGLTTLANFEARGHQPDYFSPSRYTPTADQVAESAQWQNAPADAVSFFGQVGEALRLSPMPGPTTGINDTSLDNLASWITPQYGAGETYVNPSFGQEEALAQFAPIGLTAQGFSIPSTWGPDEIAALQAGYDAGQRQVNAAAATTGASPETNFWGYINTIIGTYPNTPQGYLFRAIIVLAGGSANVPADAVYAQINTLDGSSSTQVDGNNSYELTFTPPVTHPTTLPVVGSLPPNVIDGQGNPVGFWSIHVYQTDPSEAAAPFITQASVLNTAYSSADIPVIAVDTLTDVITVEASGWGPLDTSSPIFFGPTAPRYGLAAGVAYYVATPPIAFSGTEATSYSFKISATWQQELSSANVPIQGKSGAPGPIVHLQDAGGTDTLRWGPIQPVSQLGSQQLSSGKLAKNPDGSVTIWIAHALPDGAPATNWIPTPSTAYYASIYPGVQVPTEIRPLIRIYAPTPGSYTEASILPPNGLEGATYVFPALQLREVGTATEPRELPQETLLEKIYPNPFSREAVVGFTLATGGQVKVNVYDILGRKVATLVDEIRMAGRHSATWDGRNDSGTALSSGVYFVRMEAGAQARVTTVVRIR